MSAEYPGAYKRTRSGRPARDRYAAQLDASNFLASTDASANTSLTPSPTPALPYDSISEVDAVPRPSVSRYPDPEVQEPTPEPTEAAGESPRPLPEFSDSPDLGENVDIVAPTSRNVTAHPPEAGVPGLRDEYSSEFPGQGGSGNIVHSGTLRPSPQPDTNESSNDKDTFDGATELSSSSSRRRCSNRSRIIDVIPPLLVAVALLLLAVT
ncbi:hypothetical protein CC1G_13397 [Coprinopsis cinerea okayama7|uniref:Uncharacterized protein n=1 Tax=Coprinopsis cinerea (strain Okayama-7 / 130 / ATCC MYA-4618 / FGSC 9003) TaxID=240176 RepID=A8PID1_COPC7|nr:hypothetical protein CC1G_13397 [Coprinopsis cinerea okayama7\|eukprot:XP_001841554.2 hypothetical protein CC1G_13397 [Coprinopsis cinerea okayama7\